MKATQINPVNVAISLIYCLMGFVTFFVLKLVSRHFFQKKEEFSEVKKENLCEDDLQRLNFSKIFIKTFLVKNTLIGSFINGDKKYLLRQILILSCMSVSCFNINAYILWPWSVGFGVFIISLIISQILIPLIFANLEQKKLRIEQSFQQSSQKISTSGIDSNSIQIQHTDLHMSASIQRETASSNRCLSKDGRNILENKNVDAPQGSHQRKIDFVFILIMAVITQIMFCQSILNLSLSVSNSGVLNLVSFGFCVLIDQFIARVGLGILTYGISFILHKSQAVNFFTNTLFVSYCYQNLISEIKAIKTQKKIKQMQRKITAINNPEIHRELSENEKISNKNEDLSHQISTQMKIIHPCVFDEVYEQVPVVNSQVLPVDAVLQEPEIEDQAQTQNCQQAQNDSEINKNESQNSQNQEQKLQSPQKIAQQQQKPQINQQTTEILIKSEEKQQTVEIKSTTNYFQLFENDLQVFDDSKAYQTLTTIPIKKLKKKYQPQPLKFKSDPLLYFPYEEHKHSRKVSVQQNQFKENTEKQQRQSRSRSIVDNQNFFSTIEVVDCTQDSISKQEEQQIDLVLQQKNLNIKSMTVNLQPMVLPTARPRNEEKKNKKINQNHNLVKKVSPYNVNLAAEMVKPGKPRKIQVTKNNKQNANQTNKSFMTCQAVDLSRITQKDILNFAQISNNQIQPSIRF